MSRYTEWKGADPVSAGKVRELMGTGPVATRGRLQLAMLYASRFVHRGRVKLSLRDGGNVYLSRRTLGSDWQTLREILLPRKNPYAADYAGTVVLDIGAHKGYFGAHALLSGASIVFSYEPAPENYALLERTAASFRRQGRVWETRRVAVGARDGAGLLRVSAESWTHSLRVELPESGPARALSSERVEVVSMESVLAQAADGAAGRRLVVKIDVEGTECEICLGSATSIWERVSEAFVETHAFAECGARELAESLGAAGLTASGMRGPVLWLSRRDEVR